ncbi:MAG: AAA family ATPase [Bdellovibrio sp.]|nr:AAA family ATPase [Bdellovibrio sp.]
MRSFLAEEHPQQQWIIDNLLLKGGISLLCGKPKAGKSTLARHLAVSVARGTDFLGRKTEKSVVIFLALEDHRAMLQQSFRNLGCDGSEEILVHCGSLSLGTTKQLERLIEENCAKLIIIDTLFRFTRCHDLNDYSSVLNALTPLSDLARKYHVHISAIHHAGKSERADSLDSVLGSVAVHGSMDSTLLLSKKSEFRVLESQQRYGIDFQPTTLLFDSETSRVSLGIPISDIEIATVSQEIFDFIANTTAPVSEKEITDAIGRRTKNIRKGLRLLRDDGTIVRTGSGVRNDLYRYSFPLKS